jgi:hypothetical protein
MHVRDLRLVDIHAHINSSAPDDVGKYIEDLVDSLVAETRRTMEERGVDLSQPEYAKLLKPLVRINESFFFFLFFFSSLNNLIAHFYIFFFFLSFTD